MDEYLFVGCYNRKSFVESVLIQDFYVKEGFKWWNHASDLWKVTW